ncbi:MAG TPA: hypothetical protein VGM50_21065 [Gemmatimonadaceae bacterium]
MRVLLSAATLLFAVTASAQRPKPATPVQQKPTPAPAAGKAPAIQAGTPAGPPKDPTSIAIYPLSAGTVANGAQFRVGTTPINASIGSRIAQGFTSSTQWLVLDRTDDATLADEFSRAQKTENFNSSVIVEDNKKTNARFVLNGLLDQVEQTQGVDKNCPTYRTTIHFTSTIQDVETGQTLASESFVAGWPSSNQNSIREVAKLRATKPISNMANKITGFLGGGGGAKAKCDPNAQSDALEYSLIDVKNQVADWATSTAGMRK